MVVLVAGLETLPAVVTHRDGSSAVLRHSLLTRYQWLCHDAVNALSATLWQQRPTLCSRGGGHGVCDGHTPVTLCLKRCQRRRPACCTAGHSSSRVLVTSRAFRCTSCQAFFPVLNTWPIASRIHSTAHAQPVLRAAEGMTTQSRR
jgi:hypothetical protein